MIMSGEGPQQPDEDPKMFSPDSLAHVSDPATSIRRGLAKGEFFVSLVERVGACRGQKGVSYRR